MGFLYATGIGVPVSQAKALVHYTVGAIGDSTFAQMALAYRHWAGHTVPASCPAALQLYARVAQKGKRDSKQKVSLRRNFVCCLFFSPGAQRV